MARTAVLAGVVALVGVAGTSAQAGDIPGRARLSLGGALGAAGQRADPTRITLQPLDAAGSPVGTSGSVGPATPTDRGDATVAVNCIASLDLPAGARAVRIDVTSNGGSDGANTAFVDRVFATTDAIGIPTAGVRGTNSCVRETSGGPFSPPQPTTSNPTPTPKLAALVTASSTARCRTAPARFRVKGSRRASVARLALTVRGRTTSHDPRRTSRALTVPIAGRRTRVHVRVTLTDGRTRSGTRTYRACR